MERINKISILIGIFFLITFCGSSYTKIPAVTKKPAVGNSCPMRVRCACFNDGPTGGYSDWVVGDPLNVNSVNETAAQACPRICAPRKVTYSECWNL